MFTYEYTIVICNSQSLISQIIAAGLPSPLYIDTVETLVHIHFEEELTLEQQETLETVSSVHELSTSKEHKREEVNSLRNIKLISGYTDGSARTWSTTPADISNLSGVCTLIALGVVTSEQTWRDFSNTNHTMTPAQLIQLAAELAVFVRTCYEVSWYHKGQIDAQTTVVDVNNYDISTGWPS